MSVTTLPKIIGIINVTPDSFSDGGKFMNPVAALNYAFIQKAEGADYVELGAQSTRPGSTLLSVEEELQRLRPVLDKVTALHSTALDTFHSPVAEYGLKNGVKIINDVSAGRFDKQMFSVVREYEAQLVLMHSQQDAEHPHASKTDKHYNDLITEISEFLDRRIESALAAGIKAERLILDPGCGSFLSADPEYSFELLGRVEELIVRYKSFPILLGISRKGFLKNLNGEIDALSQLFELIVAIKGVSYIRTHNVGQFASFMNVWKKYF